MKILTATDIALMGELDPTYGQTYYGNVEEQGMPVRFNLKQQVDIMPGRKIFAEEYTVRTSGKGNEYMQLKKVKLSDPGGVPGEIEVPTPSKPAQAPDSPDETPSYEAGTNARWALKLSTDTYKAVVGGMPEPGSDWTTIEDFAQWLLGAFQRLKSYDPQAATPEISENPSYEPELTDEDMPEDFGSDEPDDPGYSKAVATSQNIKKRLNPEDV